MFFIYASFLEFIAVNYLARFKWTFLTTFPKGTSINFATQNARKYHFFLIDDFMFDSCIVRWVQDPEQQKKKKENAILDVSTTDHSNTLSSLIFCVPDPKFHIKAVVPPNHNVLKVAEDRDGRPRRPLSFGEGRHAQHWGHCWVKAQGGEKVKYQSAAEFFLLGHRA